MGQKRGFGMRTKTFGTFGLGSMGLGSMGLGPDCGFDLVQG